MLQYSFCKNTVIFGEIFYICKYLKFKYIVSILDRQNIKMVLSMVHLYAVLNGSKMTSAAKAQADVFNKAENDKYIFT